MIPDTHPYWHVRSLVASRPEVLALSASYYIYRPQTLGDERTIKTIAREEFLDASYIDSLLSNTPTDYELAIHSDVRTRGGELNHLVMVDMSTSAKAHLDKLRAFVGEAFFREIEWYDSGRSFHGYGTSLLSEREWVQLFGVLLLSNKPRLEPTVDPRWIGHRLIAGYSSLRWTKNTSHYLALPVRLQRQPDTSHRAVSVGAVGRALRPSQKN